MQEQIKNMVNTLRVRHIITQEALAEALGVSRQTVIAIEKQNYTPSVLLALKISAYFKVSVEDVFKIIHSK